MNIEIVDLGEAGLNDHLAGLARVLADAVNDGAAISFMSPLTPDVAALFWLNDVRPEVAAGRRVLFGALRDGKIVGTVQLITAMPPNQPHRCEIAKMMVSPSARRLGIGRALMMAALERAWTLGKTLVTLDTRTGDRAEPLYASVGFETAGIIPDFAFDPDGKAKHATTYMYHRL